MIRTSSDTTMTKDIKLKLQSKRDKQVVISIDNTLDKKLMELAEAKDLSVSTVGYQILKQAIEHVEV
jgi:post-segregation antitoxin (ccd killing protein)